jgi:hypothetical protein
MRYRLLSFQDRRLNSQSAVDGCWKPVGGVKIADSAEDALRQHSPIAGHWMVLCEDDHSWRILEVRKREETDIVPADEDAPAISGALRS